MAMILDTSLAVAAALLAAVDAPITSVTVYSDRAQVVRTGSTPVSGTQQVELPLLPDTVDPATLRLEATGAEVRGVEIARVEEEDFPVDEAKKLALELEKLDDEVQRVQRERAAYQAQLEDVRRLSPAVPASEPLKPPARLNPTGWAAATRFTTEQAARLQVKVRELDTRLYELARRREPLAERARLLGGARRRSGHRVTATLSGNGSARLTLTYASSPARWSPTYDIQLQPESGNVQLSFSGLVSQETGEDWSDATLTLSTAIPAHSTTLPRIATWKLGERERFIPTPVPVTSPPSPPPPSPPLPRPERDEKDELRSRLLAAARGAEGRFEAEESLSAPAVKGLAREETRAPPKPKRKMAAPAPPPPPSSAPAVRPGRARAVEAPMEFAEEDAPAGAVAPSGAQMSLAPPPGYSRPSFGPDSPAALAGGYDLTFASVRPETVGSGQGARRVALFSDTWPVSVERKLFPALAPDAFLVAELKSPAKQVLPGGQANLFVGADPAGTATLELVAPGERFTLPLGLDRGVRPARNVKLVLSASGIIGQDEVNEYQVTIEVPNPYSVPMAARVLDQWPLSSHKDVEVKLLKVEPAAREDKTRGSLEWHVTVPARGKSVITFSYSIRRPKGWRLHQ